MKKKGYFKMTKNMKKDVLIGITLIICYTITKFLFPVNGMDQMDNLTNHTYRLMFIILISGGYTYYLISQFYSSRTNKKLTVALIQRENGANIYDLLKEAINISPGKYQAHIIGKDKCATTGIIFGSDDHGLLVASPEKEEEHVLCVGGTGSGKTSALLIPTLQVFKGNAFVLDISGDISKNVHRPNALTFNPLNNDSQPYNIFYSVDAVNDRTEKLEQLSQMAFLLMPDKPNNNGDGQFFLESGRKMLIACLIHFYFQGLDFTDICHKIVSTEVNDLLCEIWDAQDEDACIFISSFQGANEKNNAGCKQAMDQSIILFASNQNVRKNLRRPRDNEKSITPAAMENNDVFIQIPEQKLKTYAPLLSIIVVQMFEYFYQRPLYATKPILFALDEFARLGKIDIIDALRTLRKRHVRIILLTQSLADLDEIYGQNNRKIISDNCGYKIILKATDPDTQEYVSRLIGEYDASKMTHSWSQNNNGYSKSTQKNRIIEAAELAYLGDTLILIGPTGYMQLQKNYYFK